MIATLTIMFDFSPTKIQISHNESAIRSHVVSKLIEYFKELTYTDLSTSLTLSASSSSSFNLYNSIIQNQEERFQMPEYFTKCDRTSRGRIATPLRIQEFLHYNTADSENKLSFSEFSEGSTNELNQFDEAAIGSLVTYGIPDVSMNKEEMTRRFANTRAALFDIKEASELQQRLWGSLMNNYTKRLLVLAPETSGKRKAVLTAAAQFRLNGKIIVVTYAKQRIQELLDSVRFVPSSAIKPYWRGYSANIILLTPGHLEMVKDKRSELSMFLIDSFDQLIDCGFEVSSNIHDFLQDRSNHKSKRFYKYSFTRMTANRFYAEFLRPFRRPF